MGVRYKLAITALLVTLLPALTALGQEPPPLSWYTNSPLLVDSEPPMIELTTDAELEEVEVTLRRGRSRSEHRVGLLRPGDSTRIEFEAPLGRHEIDAIVEGVWDGEDFRVSFEFDFEVTEGLAVEVPLEDVDLDAHQLVLVLNRPVDHVDFEVTGDDGRSLGSGTVRFEGERAGSRLSVPWTQREGTVLRILLTVHDVDGFWAELELLPWSVEIPHEEVNFETGSAEIRETESPKIDDAYRQLLEAVDRYGSLVDINLYVAGYTDTVGGRGDNQALSEQRAQSIARAFRERGFSFPIFYQGFGEDALAVQTPDSADEIRNRRALYILAAQPPLPGPHVPRSSWQPID